MTNTIDKYFQSQYNEDERDAETMLFLGHGFSVSGLSINPLTPGCMSILEIIGNPASRFISDKEKYNQDDLVLLLFVLHYREQSIRLIKNEFEVQRFASEFSSYDVEEIFKQLESINKLALTGFQMIPKGKRKNISTYERQYDADWLAWIISIVSNETNLRPFEIMWRTSLTACGFYVASYCKKNGNENIARPKDLGGALRCLKEKRNGAKPESKN